MQRSFKIILLADGLWGTNSLHLLHQLPQFEVQALIARNSVSDESLIQLAKSLGIPIFQPKNINSDESVEFLKQFQSDLLVSMSYDQIFKKEALNSTRLGAINCHAGKLPWYRGRSVLNWVLINGELEFGITVHQVDLSIDTGKIIVQKCFPITDSDNYATLMQRAVEECPKLLIQALNEIQHSNQIVGREQSEIDPIGSYYPRRKIGDEQISWNWSSKRIHNFVRALVPPGPCAHTKNMQGDVFRFINSRLLDIPSELPIRNYSRSSTNSILVSTVDGFLELETLDVVNSKTGCFLSEPTSDCVDI